MLTRPQKLLLAKLVRQHQSILFGQFSSTITKKRKEQIWEDIRLQLMAQGAELKDYTAVRDNEWGNMRRSCIKRYSSVSTQAGWQKPNELDEIVLDILGLNAQQLVATSKLELISSSDEVKTTFKREANDCVGSSNLPSNPLEHHNEWDEDIMALRKRRLVLENELLELQVENYKVQLENSKLEADRLRWDFQRRKDSIDFETSSKRAKFNSSPVDESLVLS